VRVNVERVHANRVVAILEIAHVHRRQRLGNLDDLRRREETVGIPEGVPRQLLSSADEIAQGRFAALGGAGQEEVDPRACLVYGERRNQVRQDRGVRRRRGASGG
jgi:hypothetical protein